MTVWLRFLRWLGYPVKLPAERHVPTMGDLTAMQRHVNEHLSLWVAAASRFDEPRLHLAVHPGYPPPEYAAANLVGMRTTLRGAIVKEEAPWGEAFGGRWILTRDRHGDPLRVESWGWT